MLLHFLPIGFMLVIVHVFAAIEPFEPTKVEYKYIDRENELELLDTGRIHPILST